MSRTAFIIALSIAMGLTVGFPVMPGAAAAGIAWGMATLIETDDAGHALDPQVAVDPQGNAVAVWEQEDETFRSDIWANRFVPGLGWGTAERIETDAGDARDTQVAVDPQGNAVAVWEQSDGIRNNIWANRFVPGVGWGTATLIETDDAGAGSPQVAVDPQGNATAVWHQGIVDNIWANRFVPGVGWGTATLVETDAGEARSPQVAVDPQGNATAVWVQGSAIWANRFVPGVGWGTATLIDTDVGIAGAPQVAVDPQGNAVAVWEQSDGIRNNIWANRFVPGVGWGTATLIETDNAASAHFPQVVVDPAGNAVAVWDQADPARSNIWANRFVPGIGWGTPELIETETGNAGSQQVAVDPQGNAVAVWLQSRDVMANDFVPGVGWGTPQLIETEVAIAGPPQVAVDSLGNAIALWPQFDGTRFNMWANRGVEDVPPDLVITSPADGAMLPSTLVTVTGTASDDVGVDMVELSLDGTNYVLATGTTSWSGTVTLTEGSNTIFARGTDTAGNTATVSVAVTVDTANPTVAITSPADGAILNSTLVTVTGTASDDVGVDNVELSLDGTTYVLATGTTSWSGTPTLAEGSNTIFARATDTSGNTATVSIAVTVDTANPTVAITSPADGATLDSTSVVVSGTASDDVGVEKVELSLDGTNYIVATGTTSWSGTMTLSEGPNTIFARATDTSGNTATVSIAVTVDTLNPTAVAGEDQTVNAGAMASFDASASSDDVAIVSYEWDFGDGTTGTGETTTHIYTDPGTYTATLTVRDAAGNADTDVLIVTVETEPVGPIPPDVVTLGVVGVIAAIAVGAALLLWRRRAGGKKKA